MSVNKDVEKLKALDVADENVQSLSYYGENNLVNPQKLNIDYHIT